MTTTLYLCVGVCWSSHPSWFVFLLSDYLFLSRLCVFFVLLTVRIRILTQKTHSDFTVMYYWQTRTIFKASKAEYLLFNWISIIILKFQSLDCWDLIVLFVVSNGCSMYNILCKLSVKEMNVNDRYYGKSSVKITKEGYHWTKN